MKHGPAEDHDDYYWENDRCVFTTAFHLRRGYCCESGCRHCPYGFGKKVAKQKVTVSWSGGKDSAFALHKIISGQTLEVVSLHAIIDERTRTIGLHGIHESLIEKQAQSIGIPLEKIYLSISGQQDSYASAVQDFYVRCAQEGISAVVLGDIFLQDLKEYKLNLLKSVGLKGYFPLWGMDSMSILTEFLDAGYKTMICAARADLFSKEQVGNAIDYHFLSQIPTNVDPCGENGEFHTFVYNGPIFREEIKLRKGDIFEESFSYQKVAADGVIEKVKTKFWFQDLDL
jgi:uncharacterized protein (TIGR00290 family)